jgi:hypothetical protein
MRIRIWSFALILFLFLTEYSTAFAQTPKEKKIERFDDPVFGISYDATRIKYDVAPNVLKELPCFQYKEGDHVYAHLNSGKYDYYIVMNTSMRNREGDAFGSALWVEGMKCHFDDSNWVLTGVPQKGGYKESDIAEKLPGFAVHPPMACNLPGQDRFCYYTLQSSIEEKILRGLVKDAISRAIHAYGGESLFRQKACTSHTVAGVEQYPIVQEELQSFCKVNDQYRPK